MKKVLWVIIVILSVIGLLLGVNAPILTTYAYTYHNYYIDYTDYEVSDFSSYDVILNENTFDLTMNGEGYIYFQYLLDECILPTRTLLFRQALYVNDIFFGYLKDEYIQLSCSTSYNTYYKTSPWVMSDIQKNAIIDAITSDDNKSISIYLSLYDSYNHNLWNGVEFYFRSFEMQYSLYYEFNSTYYFTDLLVDAQLNPNQSLTNIVADVDDSRINLTVFYDSTNYYRFYNDDPFMLYDRGRKKYAINNGDERLTAYGMGINGKFKYEYDSFNYTIINGITNGIRIGQSIYLLNYASTQQSFPNATTDVLWDYIDPCPIWDMSCGINNALVYLAKDAPITSQVYNVVDKGWQFLSNSFYSLTDLFGAEFDDAGNLVDGNWIGIIITITLGLLVIIWGVREL